MGALKFLKEFLDEVFGSVFVIAFYWSASCGLFGGFVWF